MQRLLIALLFGAQIAVAETQTVAAAAQPAPATAEAKVVVVIETSLGNITAELYPDKAPVTVSNFLAYADEKFYDGTIFHRVRKADPAMIQGGGFTANMRQKATHAAIKNEADNGLGNVRGTLAMARTMVVDSATAQFFINHQDNAYLNFHDRSIRGYGYAVFGKVTAGLDVMDKIAAVETGAIGPFGDVPLTPVEIKSIRRQAQDK
jgi:cyclophilin family peptidyl-prolyl cis-trans isomerase